eukprot:TRINITY_DN1712_c0_g2_i1.p1 TRINITY_DN1712_c0_g2~~TRINITY_DN1712_c0_g2_i1.p1  ORF type:complete len:144 (-),score=22.26 TRINITY_DN1712_c0_g2_i1:278-709(-)
MPLPPIITQSLHKNATLPYQSTQKRFLLPHTPTLLHSTHKPTPFLTFLLNTPTLSSTQRTNKRHSPLQNLIHLPSSSFFTQTHSLPSPLNAPINVILPLQNLILSFFIQIHSLPPPLNTNTHYSPLHSCSPQNKKPSSLTAQK